MPSSPACRRIAAWYFFYFAFLGAFHPYFGLYLTSIGVSAWGIGLMLSLMQVMRLVAPNLWGWLTDRWGGRVTIIRLSAGIGFLSFLGFFLTRDFSLMVAIMAILAFFWTASLPLVEALTLCHLRGAVERYGRVRFWGSIGFIVSVQGVGLLLDWVSPQWILWIGLTLLTLTFLSTRGLSECSAPEVPHRTVTFSGVLRHPGVLTVLLAGFLMATAHAPYYVFYSIHLVALGYGKAAVGALWSLGVIAEIGVFIGMSRMMNALSLRGWLALSFIAAALRFGMIAWLAGHPWAALVAQLGHGATFGVHHAASVAALNRWTPPALHGRVLAIFGSISFGAGGMLGAVLSGWSWGQWGAGPTFSGAAGFALAGLVVIALGLRGGGDALQRPAVR